MNTKFLLITILAIALISISGCTQYGQSGGSQTGGNQSSNQTANSIEIKNFAFSPSTLTIKTGETVTWTNDDSTTHTITSDTGSELGSGSISTGQTYSHTFNTAGTFDYHCSIHTSMKGKVIVE
jgi:amicyanin